MTLRICWKCALVTVKSGVETVQATENSDYYASALETAERLRTGRLSEVDANGVG